MNKGCALTSGDEVTRCGAETAAKPLRAKRYHRIAPNIPAHDVGCRSQPVCWDAIGCLLTRVRKPLRPAECVASAIRVTMQGSANDTQEPADPSPTQRLAFRNKIRNKAQVVAVGKGFL